MERDLRSPRRVLLRPDVATMARLTSGTAGCSRVFDIGWTLAGFSSEMRIESWPSILATRSKPSSSSRREAFGSAWTTRNPFSTRSRRPGPHSTFRCLRWMWRSTTPRRSGRFSSATGGTRRYTPICLISPSSAFRSRGCQVWGSRLGRTRGERSGWSKCRRAVGRTWNWRSGTHAPSDVCPPSERSVISLQKADRPPNALVSSGGDTVLPQDALYLLAAADATIGGAPSLEALARLADIQKRYAIAASDAQRLLETASRGVAGNRRPASVSVVLVSPSGGDCTTIGEAVKRSPPGGRIAIRPGACGGGLLLDKTRGQGAGGPRAQ